MATIIGLYKNGTTGLRDGSLISIGDTETNPFQLTALSTSYPLHYRVVDDATGEDPALDSNGTFTIAAPTGYQVSTDGSSWYSSATFPAANGLNKVIYLRQIARTATTESDLTVGTAGLSFVAGSRPTQVVGQVGSKQDSGTVIYINLSWTAVGGATGYDIMWATDAGFTTGVGYGTSGTNSYQATGLTYDTNYYIRVRAVGSTGTGAWSANVVIKTTFWSYAPTNVNNALGAGWSVSGVGTAYYDTYNGTIQLGSSAYQYEPNAFAVPAGKAYSNGTTRAWSYTFTGTAWRLFVGKGSNLGKAAVTINAGAVTGSPFDLYLAGGTFPSAAMGYVGYSIYSGTQTQGTHTVKIACTNTKNAASSGTYVMPIGIAFKSG